jgi:alanine-synthesizing transaminase
VPGQWAVQTALGGFQSIRQLVQPGGRLYQSRQTVLDRVAASPWLSLVRPMGAMYAFIRLGDGVSSRFDDQQFALELLENKHVLVAPGSSFNTTYTDHFRITILPDPETLHIVFDRMDELLEHHAAA